jgi:hypothetical protein
MIVVGPDKIKKARRPTTERLPRLVAARTIC